MRMNAIIGKLLPLTFPNKLLFIICPVNAKNNKNKKNKRKTNMISTIMCVVICSFVFLTNMDINLTYL